MVALGTLILIAGALCGCGGPHRSAAELRLEREDLIAVCRALKSVQAPVASELAAAKRAWPLVFDGLPRSAAALAGTRTAVSRAAASAARLTEPPPMTETENRYLTGPGSPLAGLYRQYVGLSTHGWALIGAAIDQIEHGTPAGAQFARANVGLYIESVYDGHFDLAQIDKHLTHSYRELGGQPVFGSALTQAEVNALAAAYSEASARLRPHVGVQFGS